MVDLVIFEVEAKSFEGRLPLTHRFTIAAKDEDDALEAIQLRWPELYEVSIRRV